MRAWQVHELGEPAAVMRLEDVPDPVPGPGQALVRVLSVKVDRPLTQFGERGDGREPPVGVGARPAVGGNHPRHDVLVVAHDEPTLDTSLVGTGSHHRRVGTTADQQTDRLDEHRLAGAGLPGEDGEPWRDDEVEVLDDTEVLDVQLAQHSRHRPQRSARPNFARSTWWNRRRPKRTKRASSPAGRQRTRSPDASAATVRPSTVSTTPR